MPWQGNDLSNPYPIDGARDALWRATAVAPVDCRPLDGDIDADVAIIGAGFTGLNAALVLAEAGTSVVVLEGADLGFGASGRSGGQVNLGLNLGPSALIARFGEGAGRRLIERLAGVPDEVFALIERHDLNCDPVQMGWVQGAASDGQRRLQENLARDYERHGVHFDVLDAAQVQRRSGAHGYKGGLFCATAGSLHPLSYTREMARVALGMGVQLFTHSPVTALEREGRHWRLSCAGASGGRVRAETVLVCTNAYTDDLVDGLKETVVPVRSLLMASEPLPMELRDRVMPGEVTFVDKRRLILYLRYDRDGRLCAGDHGPMRDGFRLEDYTAVKRRVVEVFPDLAGVRWDYHWGGRVAMTRSKLPFIQVVDDGLVAGMGYNGRGVGMGSIMGRILAEFVLGKPEGELDFPVSTPKPFAFHPFHRIGATVAIAWHGLMDRIEMRGNR